MSAQNAVKSGPGAYNDSLGSDSRKVAAFYRPPKGRDSIQCVIWLAVQMSSFYLNLAITTPGLHQT